MGLASATNVYDPIKNDDYHDGRYERIKEFKSLQKDLLAIKNAQDALADSVLKNLESFSSPEEKREIILTLRSELAQDASLQNQKKAELSEKVSKETERLKSEMKVLIGSDDPQGAIIKKLSKDLDQVCNGHLHAMKILSNRFAVNDTDDEMQNELLSFVNSIERAERTCQCLKELMKIINNIQTTEERIESLLGENIVHTASRKTVLSAIFSRIRDAIKNVRVFHLLLQTN